MAKKACNIDSCAVREAMEVFGGKWKNMILHVIGVNTKIRFNQLKRELPNVSQKMLTQQLRELERDGIISRKHFQEVPPRVEYSITELGLTIGEVYKFINEWQAQNMEEVKQCRDQYDQRKEKEMSGRKIK